MSWFVFSKNNSGNEPSSVYGPVSQDDIEINPQVERLLSIPIIDTKYLGWLLFIIAIVLNLGQFSLVWRRSETRCFDDQMFDTPSIWEQKSSENGPNQNCPTFLSNIDGEAYDIYSRDNPKVDEAWEALLVDDMTYISAHEMTHLPAGEETAQARDGIGYLVIGEAFHQLHCLNSLRKEFFDDSKAQKKVKGFKEAGGHADHCFSYLVQSLLCHADTGVMTTRFDPRRDVYHANFNVTKTCRNYDAIREWVAEKNEGKVVE